VRRQEQRDSKRLRKRLVGGAGDYSLRRGDADLLVFCFAKPKDAEAFCERFGREHLPETQRRIALGEKRPRSYAAAGIVDAAGELKIHRAAFAAALLCVVVHQSESRLELLWKVVQTRLGHSTVTITADVHGHPFPRTDDGSELAQTELKLLG